MTDQVERFMGPISSHLRPEADGQWVRYSDYEKLKAQRDCAVETQENANRVSSRLEAERDQVRKQVLDEVGEKLRMPIGRVEGALVILRDEEKFPWINRRGLVEILDDLLSALNPDHPEPQESGRGASEGSSPPKASELSADPSDPSSPGPKGKGQ